MTYHEGSFSEEEVISKRKKYYSGISTISGSLIQEEMPEESTDLLLTEGRYEIHPEQTFRDFLFILRSRVGTELRNIAIKHIWKPSTAFEANLTVYPHFYEAIENQINFSEDTGETMSLLPSISESLEPEPYIWRGIFTLDYPRKVLFTKKVKIKTTELPRWKPYITIDRRTLERQEDEQ